MAAVVESMSEVGYQKTTATEIARRAGVSWGAVQHHFGDKDGILLAVLEDSFDRLADQLADVPSPDDALKSRVHLFLSRSWMHFSSDHYRSTFEILLNLPDEVEFSWEGEMLAAWTRLWSQYFPESRPGRRGTIELMHYTISVLSGLVTTQMLEQRRSRGIRRAAELGLLEDTLVRSLSREGA